MGEKTIKSGEIRLSDLLISALIGYVVFLVTSNLIYSIAGGIVFLLIGIYISSKRKQS